MRERRRTARSRSPSARPARWPRSRCGPGTRSPPAPRTRLATHPATPDAASHRKLLGALAEAQPSGPAARTVPRDLRWCESDGAPARPDPRGPVSGPRARERPAETTSAGPRGVRGTCRPGRARRGARPRDSERTAA